MIWRSSLGFGLVSESDRPFRACRRHFQPWVFSPAGFSKSRREWTKCTVSRARWTDSGLCRHWTSWITVSPLLAP